MISILFIFTLYLLLIQLGFIPPMGQNGSEYSIDDLLNHPSIRNDAAFNLQTAMLQLDALDIIDQCEDAKTAWNNHKQSSQTLLNELVDLWTNIANIWDVLKDFHKSLKQKNVLHMSFTLWVPNYLYENKLLDVVVTDGKEYKYKQIRRYVKLPFPKVKEFWPLDNEKGLVLPCDVLVGPFISNNRQLFRAGELYKLMKNEQPEWDDSLSILDNFRALPHLLYYYSDMLPFQHVTWNKYDRSVYFSENPSEAGRRADLAVREKKKTNYLMNRKEIKLQNIISGLESKVEKHKQEIDRKEQVLQFTLTAHNNLKQSYAQLQQQYNVLWQQNFMPNHQNNMQHHIPNNFYWNQNNFNNNVYMFHQ
eukprot:137956_1